ncbi:MAG TPA: hypothetical protein DCP53_09295 [Elusimicrobia bacterium]|nr:MAG: hypothetical protein A2551_07520 [Elusimicrobia bacterium RIFOXYD2_FULL_34_30]HAM39568.1 hypothetical protein [Elusimicrobiota bacterium]
MKIKKMCLFIMLLVGYFLFIDYLFSYTINSSVVDTHGNKATGGTYELLSAGGQGVIGNSSGSTYTMETGFINSDIVFIAGNNQKLRRGTCPFLSSI